MYVHPDSNRGLISSTINTEKQDRLKNNTGVVELNRISYGRKVVLFFCNKDGPWTIPQDFYYRLCIVPIFKNVKKH